MQPTRVRDATADDVPAMMAIYNEIVANSTAIYSFNPSSVDERREWFRVRTGGGWPVLAALRGEELVGYASFSEFRGAWPGYQHSVEHSVYVRADCRHQGIGRALLQALLPVAAKMGKHVMIAGVDAANTA